MFRKMPIALLLLFILLALSLGFIQAGDSCFPSYGANGRLNCSTITRTNISGFVAIGTQVTVSKDYHDGNGVQTSLGIIVGYQLTYIPDHPYPEVQFIIDTEVTMGGSIFTEQAYEWFDFSVN